MIFITGEKSPQTWLMYNLKKKKKKDVSALGVADKEDGNKSCYKGLVTRLFLYVFGRMVCQSKITSCTCLHGFSAELVTARSAYLPFALARNGRHLGFRKNGSSTWTNFIRAPCANRRNSTTVFKNTAKVCRHTLLFKYIYKILYI